MGLFTRSHRIPPAKASIQCLETHEHSHDQFRIVMFCMNVAVAESVRSSSVAVVSGHIIATTDDCMPICKTYTRRMQN